MDQDKQVFLQEPQKLDTSRDIIHCHPYLQERWPKLVHMFQQETGNDLLITSTYRSAREQNRLYQFGRTMPGQIITQIDGHEKKSKHNLYPAEALDVAINIESPFSKAVVSWDEEKYHPLVRICDKLGLISGGSWEHWKDWPHIEFHK